MPKQYLVIPLYDHTSIEEVVDTLDALECMGIDDTYVVHAQPPERDLLLQATYARTPRYAA